MAHRSKRQEKKLLKKALHKLFTENGPAFQKLMESAAKHFQREVLKPAAEPDQQAIDKIVEAEMQLPH